MSITQEFFTNLQSQSQEKLTILDMYLEKWAYILGYSFTSLQRRTPLYYVDLFAGQGQYGNGQPGSPIIALNTLTRVQQNLMQDHDKNPNYNLIAVEKDPNNFIQLNENIQKFKSKVIVKTLNLEAIEALGVIENMVNNSPSLFFVDPFGVKDIPFSMIERISRIQRSDLIINFMYNFVQRFHNFEGVSDTLCELFGTDEFKHVTFDKERELIHLYRKQLQKIGYFTLNYKIKMPGKDRTYFHLIYATKEPRAIIEMKKVFKNMHESIQLDLFEIMERVNYELEVLQKYNSPITFSQFIARELQSTEFNDSDLRKTLKSMKKKGLVDFDSNKLSDYRTVRNMLLYFKRNNGSFPQL